MLPNQYVEREREKERERERERGGECVYTIYKYDGEYMIVYNFAIPNC